jgi:hypothetical protein
MESDLALKTMKSKDTKKKRKQQITSMDYGTILIMKRVYKYTEMENNQSYFEL